LQKAKHLLGKLRRKLVKQLQKAKVEDGTTIALSDSTSHCWKNAAQLAYKTQLMATQLMALPFWCPGSGDNQ
jgi:hypothetical protein